MDNVVCISLVNINEGNMRSGMIIPEGHNLVICLVFFDRFLLSHLLSNWCKPESCTNKKFHDKLVLWLLKSRKRRCTFSFEIRALIMSHLTILLALHSFLCDFLAIQNHHTHFTAALFLSVFIGFLLMMCMVSDHCRRLHHKRQNKEQRVNYKCEMKLLPSVINGEKR